MPSLPSCARALGLAAALALPAPALAHIVIAESQAAPGAYHVAGFQVGHGCAGAATTALRVEIPAGVESAKPQPKPGWTVEPIRGADGRTAAVVWRGQLADDQFEVFSLLLKLPAASGPVYFPTTQSCGAAQTRWTDIPAPGAAWTSVSHPAPVLVLGASGEAPAGGHSHH
jgi:uncharacterized protein YcnI